MNVRNYFRRWSVALVAALPLLAAGCTSTSTTSVVQQIYNVAWLPDQSGLLAVVQRQTISALDGSSSYTRGVHRVGLDGTIGAAIGPGDMGVSSSYGFVVLGVSPDGTSAVTQLGSNVYRLDLKSNNFTLLVSGTNLLGVSPDTKYVLTTAYDPAVPAPLYSVYDVSGSSSRQVGLQFAAVGVMSSAGRSLWIDGGSFALTHYDSNSYTHVSIWDTTGTVKRSFSDASATFALSQIAYAAGILYIQTRDGSIQGIHLATGLRDTILTGTTYESMDAAQDGSLLSYTGGDSANVYLLKALNPANGHTATVATDAYTPFISPHGDKVAYIHRADPNQDIKITAISVPQ